MALLNELALGVGLGLGLGWLEALNLNVLLSRAETWRTKADDVIRTSVQIVAIPTLLTGPWLSTRLIEWATPSNYASVYVLAFVIMLVIGTRRSWTAVADTAAEAWGAPKRA